jgi:hypothetical protein
MIRISANGNSSPAAATPDFMIALAGPSCASARLAMWPGNRSAITARASRPARMVEQVARLLEDRRAADLPDHAPPRLVVGLDPVEHRTDARGRLILERPDQVVAGGSAAVEERARDGFVKAIARRRHDVTTDPVPGRPQGGPSNSSWLPVSGLLADQERFQRSEEQPRHGAEAPRARRSRERICALPAAADRHPGLRPRSARNAQAPRSAEPVLRAQAAADIAESA